MAGPDLDEFLFGQPALFVIPIEALTTEGMRPAFAERLRAHRGVSADWCARFDEAFATMWQRVTDLAKWAPRQWLPPRRLHVCVVTDPDLVRPMTPPLPGVSWLAYADAFDPSRGREVGAFSLVLAERMLSAPDVQQAFVQTLGYWLPRTHDETASFLADAPGWRRRPDRATFDALAQALPTIRGLYHETLRRPPAEAVGNLRRIAVAGVLAPPDAAPRLRDFTRAVREAAEATASTYVARHAPGDDDTHAVALGRWLADAAPDLLIADVQGRFVWDPDTPTQVEDFVEACGTIAEAPARSIREDLETIAAHSRRLRDALADPWALPRSSDQVDPEDGVYIHTGQHKIVYTLRQPGFDPLREPSPPFHRWLLQARTIHEWGHLLEEGRVLGVPPDAEATHARAKRDVAAAFEDLAAAAPAKVREAIAAQPDARGFSGSPGELVAELVTGRMSDYLSNLLARRFLSTAAMQSYLRANVPAHVAEGLDPLSLVARHAYEYQYLHLAQVDDPWAYLCASTWISDLYLDNGLLDGARLRALLDAVATLCDTYRIDDSAFRSPS